MKNQPKKPKIAIKKAVAVKMAAPAKVVNQPKPAKVTVGRLKQVVDSLGKERSFNQKLMPKPSGWTEENTRPGSKGRHDYYEEKRKADFYQRKINSQSKAIDKYNNIIKKASVKNK